MLAIFTSEKILSDIYHDSRFDIWMQLFEKLHPQINVLIDGSGDYPPDDDDSPLFRLEHDYDIIVKTHPLPPRDDRNYDRAYSRFHSAACAHPFSLYIVEKKKKAETVRRTSGVACIAMEEIDASPIFQEGIEKILSKGERQRGWHELLLEEATRPSNALIFVDRYLFSQDNESDACDDALSNVFEVLDHVLPPQLSVKYHVMLVFDASTIKRSAGLTFELVARRLDQLKAWLKRPYPIVFEAISIDRNDLNYGETHNRRILSNYFIIRADHSLKAFREGRSLYSQSLLLDWVASKGITRQTRSDLPGKALYKYIRDVRQAVHHQISSHAPTLYSLDGTTSTTIGKITNRLLKSES